jgi:hypothetical protein
MNSYHDIEIGCKNRIYKMMNIPFHMRLFCERTAGWEFWEMQNRQAGVHKDTLVAGEFSSEPFEIQIHGAVVCSNRWVYPATPDALALAEHQEFTCGLLKLETLWLEDEQELRIYFSPDQVSAYEDIAAYNLKFGGLYWAGYFWKANLTEAFAILGGRVQARFTLSEPKTDENS